MVPKTKGLKFKDSSLAFFELNEKDTISYDLKKWFKAGGTPSLTGSYGVIDGVSHPSAGVSVNEKKMKP
eukprot:SAG11_NODE_7613_length_1121_cov_1.134051_2_plen_69_part_00